MTKAQTKVLERKHLGVFPFEFDEGKGADEAAIPSMIHLIPVGTWAHDVYGPIVIGPTDIREFEQNYNAKIRKGVFITAGHEGYAELPAQGWIIRVEARSDGLWGEVDWTSLGLETLADKQYKFFSPEFYPIYEDPETHVISRNVLTGGALTKSPYFKELEAVVFSDKHIKKIKANENTMDITTILAKDKSTLTDEEKAFLVEHKADLSAEQIDGVKDVVTGLVDAPAETEEEKTAREEKEKGDANEAAGLNRDGSVKEVAASEKGKFVQITAGEHAALVKAADEGKQAYAAMRAGALTTAVKGLIFDSKTNTTGKFLPKEEATLRTFIEKLDDKQRVSFADLVAKIPASQLFTEKGSAEAETGSAEAEVEVKTSKLMSEKKMSYSDALKHVFGEDTGLHDRYVSETAAK